MLRDFFLSALSMSDISYCFFTAFGLNGDQFSQFEVIQ